MKASIRGLVYGHYKSIREFSKAVGWDRTKACNIVNGTREPRVSEIQDMSRALGLSPEHVASIFLSE